MIPFEMQEKFLPILFNDPAVRLVTTDFNNREYEALAHPVDEETYTEEIYYDLVAFPVAFKLFLLFLYTTERAPIKN